jgi:hypothetical protein
MRVTTELSGRKESLPLFKALTGVVDQFVKSTTPHSAKGRRDLCHVLSPQLQVIVDIEDDVEPKGAIPLDSMRRSFLQADVLTLEGNSSPVDIMCLMFKGDVVLRWRRLARANVSCLHADFESLSFLVEAYKDEDPPLSVVDYVDKLAAGLHAAPNITDSHRLALLSLLKAEQEVQIDRRARLAAAIDNTRFPFVMKGRVRGALERRPDLEDSARHQISEQLKNVVELSNRYRQKRRNEVVQELKDTEEQISSGLGSEKELSKRDRLDRTLKIIDSEYSEPEWIPLPPGA